MRHEEFMQIATIVDKIKQTDVYETYVKAHEALEASTASLELLDAYHAIQDTYATSVVDGMSDAAEKADVKRQLLEKKMALNADKTIHDYFTMARTFEFFLDDLNYEINQMLGKKKKKQCGTHKAS